MWLHYYIENKIGVSIIDRIQHCRTENALERDKNQEMWLRFYIEDKTGVCIIDSIPHCLTENVLKIGKNQEMWLRYYIEDKNGVRYLSSVVFHTVILKMLLKDERTKKCGFVSI